MDFTLRGAAELVNRRRGFQPWPGAFTQLDGKKLIVHGMREAAPPSAPADAAPGRIHTADRRLFVACAGPSWLELTEVQMEGKKRIPAAEFLRGTPLSGYSFG
jgi:methionyl-tRNA formyltransferase